MLHPSSSSAHGDSFMHHAVSSPAALPTVPTQIPHLGFWDGNGGSFPPFTIIAASSPPSSSLSLPSSFYLRRSISSHSPPLHLQFPDPLNTNAAFSSPPPSSCQLPLHPHSSSPSSSSGDFVEFSSGPMRRVFSAGDLQGMNPSPQPPPPPAGDNYSQGAAPFSQKVVPYSAEVRKERIERYRTKRHRRNFNKKITYACRKTLADNRPRVQGRFTRNGETGADADADLDREASNNSYEYHSCNDLTCNSNSSVRYYSHRDSSNSTGEWWLGMPVATTAADEPWQHLEQLGVDGYDELWASLADVLSVNGEPGLADRETCY